MHLHTLATHIKGTATLIEGLKPADFTQGITDGENRLNDLSGNLARLGEKLSPILILSLEDQPQALRALERLKIEFLCEKQRFTVLDKMLLKLAERYHLLYQREEIRRVERNLNMAEITISARQDRELTHKGLKLFGVMLQECAQQLQKLSALDAKNEWSHVLKAYGKSEANIIFERLFLCNREIEFLSHARRVLTERALVASADVSALDSKSEHSPAQAASNSNPQPGDAKSQIPAEAVVKLLQQVSQLEKQAQCVLLQTHLSNMKLLQQQVSASRVDHHYIVNDIVERVTPVIKILTQALAEGEPAADKGKLLYGYTDPTPHIALAAELIAKAKETYPSDEALLKAETALQKIQKQWNEKFPQASTAHVTSDAKLSVPAQVSGKTASVRVSAGVSAGAKTKDAKWAEPSDLAVTADMKDSSGRDSKQEVDAPKGPRYVVSPAQLEHYKAAYKKASEMSERSHINAMNAGVPLHAMRLVLRNKTLTAPLELRFDDNILSPDAINRATVIAMQKHPTGDVELWKEVQDIKVTRNEFQRWSDAYESTQGNTNAKLEAAKKAGAPKHPEILAEVARFTRFDGPYTVTVNLLNPPNIDELLNPRSSPGILEVLWADAGWIGRQFRDHPVRTIFVLSLTVASVFFPPVFAAWGIASNIGAAVLAFGLSSALFSRQSETNLQAFTKRFEPKNTAGKVLFYLAVAGLAFVGAYFAGPVVAGKLLAAQWVATWQPVIQAGLAFLGFCVVSGLMGLCGRQGSTPGAGYKLVQPKAVLDDDQRLRDQGPSQAAKLQPLHNNNNANTNTKMKGTNANSAQGGVGDSKNGGDVGAGQQSSAVNSADDYHSPALNAKRQQAKPFSVAQEESGAEDNIVAEDNSDRAALSIGPLLPAGHSQSG